MSTTSTVSTTLRCALAILVAAAGCGGPLDAQRPETFREERRVTAIDLVVGFEAGAVREWAAENPVPGGLEPGDFEVLYGGAPQPVITLGPVDEPWRVVVFFDAALASTADLRWAASALAGESERLAALGEVEIAVGDPAPRVVLPPTREAERIAGMLAQLAQTQEGLDELRSLRAQAVKELRQPEEEPGPELVGEIAAEEERIVRARHDDLLLFLAERGGDPPRRALIMASSGYDLHPEDFYRPLIVTAVEPAAGAAAEAAAGAAGASVLAASTETLARTLAAYGWINLQLLAPEEDPLERGARLGKLRLTGPSVEVEEQTAVYEQYTRTVLYLFGGRLEGQRKPKRAEAFLDLGRALHAQGKLKEAEDALRQAIHHFGGHPRTAESQAEAFVLLGRVLDEQEKLQEATAAFRLARRLDPETVDAAAGRIAALNDPAAPIETLARATAGELVKSAGELEKALERLARRVRLTYQVTGPPDGRLHPLEARFKDGARRLVYPAWARASIPEPVAAARARRLLAGEPTGGGLPLAADFVPAAGTPRRGAVEVRFALAEEQRRAAAGEQRKVGERPLLRLTLGYGGPDVEPRVEHRPLGPQSFAGREAWTFQASVELPEDRPWLAVLVEDLETGLWGGRLIELPE